VYAVRALKIGMEFKMPIEGFKFLKRSFEFDMKKNFSLVRLTHEELLALKWLFPCYK
jgi:hypothetical protein